MAVVAVAIQPRDVASLVRWGCEFASGDDAGLVLVQPRLGPESRLEELEPDQHEDPFLSEVLARCEEERSVLGEDGEQRILPALRVMRVHGPDLLHEVLELIEEVDGQLLMLAKSEKLRGGGADLTLTRQLFRRASCASMLLRATPESHLQRHRVLVPTAGGPNADAALRWANRMARHTNSRITALLVEPTPGEDPELVGERLLEAAISDAGLEDSEQIDRRVVVANSVQNAIRDVAEEGFDLILIGASYHGFIRQILFSTLPPHLLEGGSATAVGVLRAPRRLVSRTMEALQFWFSRRLPQLTRQERVMLFETLQSRSRWDVDFLSLMALSTAIAALGLIQGSTAVVIGAMLVAPLMIPLLSAGMSLVQGNLPLLRTAGRALTLGFLTALVIGFILGLLSPMPSLSDELTARGAPTLLDLGIAFLSGLAAAYASARPALSAALPGVAIAAALVPPIATVGVSLAQGAGRNALGAALLFTTNVVAIVLGAAVCLYALGLRSGPREARYPLWVRRVLISLLLGTVLLAIPLTSVLVSSLQTTARAPFAITQLRNTLEEHLGDTPQVRLEGLQTVSKSPWTFEVVVSTPTSLEPAMAQNLANAASVLLERPIRIRLVETLVLYGDSALPKTVETPDSESPQTLSEDSQTQPSALAPDTEPK